MGLLDDLRRRSSQAKQHDFGADIRERIARKDAESRQKVWDDEWVKVRKALDDFEVIVKALANAGCRSAGVYDLDFNDYFFPRSNCRDVGSQKRYRGPVPEYADLLVKHCKELGLKSEWQYRYGQFNADTGSTPFLGLSLEVSWD
jgi:hypothetical protein